MDAKFYIRIVAWIIAAAAVVAVGYFVNKWMTIPTGLVALIALWWGGWLSINTV